LSSGQEKEIFISFVHDIIQDKQLTMKYFFLLALSLTSFVAISQTSMNMNLRHNWNDATLPLRSGLRYNEIWGYSDPDDGSEYAIMGSVNKVHFFNITNPDSPVEVAAFTGGNPSLWRDMKTYGKYAYSVADEGTEGLMVFDLDNLPGSVSKVLQTTAFFSKCHNIFIDTLAGRLYAAGCNTQSNGLIVLDLTANPASPALLASTALAGGYVHDVYVRNNMAYCSHGFNGLYVYDMINPASPVFQGSLSGYSQAGYNHSSWLNTAGDRLVFCDETHGSSIKIADVSDLSNIRLLSLFKSAMLAPSYTNSIAHNPFIKGDSVYISYYHEGMQVFDISNPANVQCVAYYDTNPTNANYSGYDGSWGVYPYLPSGNIIASDTKNGLFVLSFAPAAPLPVEWGGLEAQQQSNQTLLKWITYSEQNNALFEVERSADGIQFKTLGQVVPAGNSGVPNDYFFTDRLPLPGLNYYRIRQTDYDGKFSFSETVSVTFENNSRQPRVFPSLIHPGETCFLRSDGLDGPVNMTIIGTSGLVLHQELLSWQSGTASFDWPAGLHTSGMYFIRLEAGDQVRTLRVMVR
jgi:choice-of-anchor B domain-containing protein